METDIIVAIIGASAVIVAALIPVLFSHKGETGNNQNSNNEIKQEQSGNSNTQIGIQNNYVGQSSDLDEAIEKKIEKYLEEHTVTDEDIDVLFDNKKSVAYYEENNVAGGKTVYIDCIPKANVKIKQQSPLYCCEALKGTFTFDYSNNNGEFTIGKGLHLFVTKWSKASNTSIHAYKDGCGMDSIARVKSIQQLPFELHGEFDFSSRVRTPNVGDMIVWKNKYGKYAATRVVKIADDTRGDDHDELTCEYIIYT